MTRLADRPTLGHLRGLWRQWSLFVAGEGAAALVGAVAILQGVIYNLHPTNGADGRDVHDDPGDDRIYLRSAQW